MTSATVPLEGGEVGEDVNPMPRWDQCDSVEQFAAARHRAMKAYPARRNGIAV